VGTPLPANAKHDTPKNSVGNIRAREAAATPVMSNVTVSWQTQPVAVDDTVIDVAVGQDGVLARRVATP